MGFLFGGGNKGPSLQQKYQDALRQGTADAAARQQQEQQRADIQSQRDAQEKRYKLADEAEEAKRKKEMEDSRLAAGGMFGVPVGSQLGNDSMSRSVFLS